MDEKRSNGASTKPQRKLKFMPKAPPRREQKLVLPKPEKVEETETNDVKAQELLKRFNEASNRPKFKPETKSSKTRVSSFNFGSSGPKPGGGNATTSGIGTKEYKEPWDYYKYYPVTLPVRTPYSGNPGKKIFGQKLFRSAQPPDPFKQVPKESPVVLLFYELLDEQEFKDDSETNAYNESSLKPAEELGLMEEDLEKKLIFMQLPPALPLPKQSVKTEGGDGTASSSKPLNNTGLSSKGCSLNELPAGFMGKMLVYKSGAVKLKLGDHLYNVTGGLDCTFAQDVVAINTEEKHCCNVGELNKRAIVTPDIDSILDNIKDL